MKLIENKGNLILWSRRRKAKCNNVLILLKFIQRAGSRKQEAGSRKKQTIQQQEQIDYKTI